jgi:hypothetical protein
MIEFWFHDVLREYKRGNPIRRGWQVGVVLFTIGRFAIVRWDNDMMGWA